MRKNRYDLMEIAGAFGDIGTLIPFVIAYISIVRVDPVGMLFAFGVSQIAAGIFYKTPIPVQPMKAIGAAAILKPGSATPGVMMGACLATGIFWLLMGTTNTITIVAGLAKKPVVRGIMAGLGMSFIWRSIGYMAGSIAVSFIALAATFFLFNRTRIPAMFFLLLYGLAISLINSHQGFAELAVIRPAFRVPQLFPADVPFRDLLAGMVYFALPQLPLTLGNAIIAITEENNRWFPWRPVTVRQMAVSTGLMNIFSGLAGGVPMCHGAGGMAGHIRFGARTGGAPVMLGSMLVVLALFFSDSVMILFNFFPESVLGVILFAAGWSLIQSALNSLRQPEDFFISAVTAVIVLWNIGAAFIAGILLYSLLKSKSVHFKF